MPLGFLPLLLFATLGADSTRLTPGDHHRTIDVAGRQRTYLVHVPESYDASQPTPAVLVFHGFGADGAAMARFCGMNAKADQEGFITVYPYGTGARIFRLFNGGGARNDIAKNLPDDIQFVDRLLDELSAEANVDTRRIYATGFSNGAMMCHRLAVERSERVAAIATVAGTMANGLPEPTRPVPVLHFHGTADPAFSFRGGIDGASEAFDVMSVEETIQFWAGQHECLPKPKVWDKKDQFDDGTTVRRRSYQTKEGDVRVVFYVIEGAGHNWPGQKPPWFLRTWGTWTKEISANDLIWEFFDQNPLDAEEESDKVTR
ncbi:MAG: PHB depolymerase family esterase [Pirellulaceae bacterium]